MKTLLIVLGLVWAGEAMPQTATTEDRPKAETVQRAQKAMVVAHTEEQNRIVAGSVTYSGIAVAAVKADNKLQLLNPVAPKKYGKTEDSVARDPITGRATGLKIFSIKF